MLRRATDSEVLRIDHMDPVSRGGSNGDDDLQALYRRCNVRKGNHTCDAFLERCRELVGGVKRPPPRTVPQRGFVEIMLSADARESVRKCEPRSILGSETTR